MAKVKAKAKTVGAKKRPAKRAVKKSASRKTANARTGRGKMKHVPWHSVELESLAPLLQRQFVVGQKIMVARILMKTGCVVPLHSHHNEQISYVLEGALKFSIDGREIVVNAGELLAIPPHMPHKVEAVMDAVAIDIFDPPRTDWINKTDQYLRGK